MVLGRRERDLVRLYGKHPVLERIKARPGTIKKLYLQKQTDLSEIVVACKSSGLRFDSVEKNDFSRKYGDLHTQGVVAEVGEFEYTPFAEVLSDCVKNAAIPVFLDGITDPQNLGSIIRNLACLGGFSLVLPEHDSAGVNETVLRVAAGGENYLKIAKVTNIATALKKVKDMGILITGADTEKALDLTKTDVPLPLAVVVGSEGKGIRPGVRKQLDLALTIPMDGAPLSYNAAVATVLFCYEIRRKLRNVE